MAHRILATLALVFVLATYLRAAKPVLRRVNFSTSPPIPDWLMAPPCATPSSWCKSTI
jgi:hypothetical protein